MIHHPIQETSDAMITAQPAPKWVSWSYKKEHLSGRFHSNTDGLDRFIQWLKSRPYCNNTMEVYPESRILVMCLGIGILLRDLRVIQDEFGEDREDVDSSTKDPGMLHLQKSQLEWAHAQDVLGICTGIVGGLKTCLNQRHAENADDPGSRGKVQRTKQQKKSPDRYGLAMQLSEHNC